MASLERPDPKRERPAGARLPYARMIDPHTIETRDGRLMQIIRLQGLSFETADTAELNYRKAVRETLFRSIADSRFAIYHHVVRRGVTPRVTGAYDNPFCQSLHAQWRERLGVRRLFVNDLYLTVIRRPIDGHVGLVDRLVKAVRGAGDPREAAALRSRERSALGAAVSAILSTLAPYGAKLLGDRGEAVGRVSEPLGMLASLFNAESRDLRAPLGDLGLHLPFRRVSFGADAFELESSGHFPARFGAMISIKDYPAHTQPGMLDDLLRLPFEMALTESFAFLEREAALNRMGLAARRMRAADDAALSLREDLVSAKDDVAAGRAAFGEHHLTVTVYASSLDALDIAAADVLSAFTEQGVIAVRENVNLEAAFWAQFPGNFKDIARRALVSTGNFAGLVSGHNFPLGRAKDAHWGEAVTVLETTAAGPYHFNFHHGDLGNFTVIGPSGSGKTVVLGFLLAQAQKFLPRTVYFDKDRGAEIFLRAIGGHYGVLRPGRATGLNPLQLSDTKENRRFLIDWAGRLVRHEDEALGAEDRALISEAVDANFTQPPQYRRLKYFAELFRGVRRPTADDLAARLAAWHGDGDHAWLFDNENDELDLEARTIGFDMTQLLDDRTLRTPAMMYLFHRVEQRLDGQPAIIVVDEGWKALDDEVFVARIKDWEKTIRKRNGIVGFATQSAQDALSSRIASAIIEQAATQIFMVNPKAQASEYCAGFGLTAHEFDLVRTLPDTARCFLIKHAGESVLARLDLSDMPDVLTVLSGREASVRRLDALRATLGDAPSAWLPKLLATA